MTMMNQRMRTTTEPLKGTAERIEEPAPMAGTARIARTDLTVLSPNKKNEAIIAHVERDSLSMDSYPESPLEFSGDGTQSKENPTELVKHPDHYNQGKIEVIDFINDQVDNGLCWNLGTAIKHLSRSPHKGQEVTDLQKAIWYTQHKLVRITSPEEVATWLESVAEGIRKKAKK